MICPGWIFPQTRVEKAEVLEFIINHHWRHDGPVLIRIVCLMLTVKALYFKGRSWEYRIPESPSSTLMSELLPATALEAGSTSAPWGHGDPGSRLPSVSIPGWCIYILLMSVSENWGIPPNDQKLLFYFFDMFQCGTIWWSTNKHGIIYLIFRQYTDVTDVWIYVSDLWRPSCLHHQVNKHEDDIAYCFFLQSSGQIEIPKSCLIFVFEPQEQQPIIA